MPEIQRPLLQLNDVDVFYGRVHALKSVSLTVNEGELVTLVGANGAGKSTTLKTISGMLRPQSGEILFADQRIERMSLEAIVKLGIAHCPEGRRIFPDLMVEENLRLGAYTRKDKSGIVEDLEEIYKIFPILKERQKQLAGSLSGGEQQMLAIGRAMMSRPRLLLIDEVSMGLMPILVKRVFSVIGDLRQHGVSILLVEQNAYEALKVVDRACVLENGQIVLEGSPDELANDVRVKSAYLGG